MLLSERPLIRGYGAPPSSDQIKSNPTLGTIETLRLFTKQGSLTTNSLSQIGRIALLRHTIAYSVKYEKNCKEKRRERRRLRSNCREARRDRDNRMSRT